MRVFINKCLDWLYPPRCVVCDGILNEGEQGIHKECRKKITVIEGAVCMHCGRPVVNERIEYCLDCSKKKQNLSGRETFLQGKSLFLYQGMMKKSMYRFKYSNKREYGAFFAKTALEQWGTWMEERQIDAIVPVPMYGWKQRVRGYNQAEIFARALSRETGIPLVCNGVRRIRDTTPMKQLNDTERKNNLKNAFQIVNNVVKSKCILLVDDIYTTGSTADEVSRMLKGAGSREVFFLSICIGQGV